MFKLFLNATYDFMVTVNISKYFNCEENSSQVFVADLENNTEFFKCEPVFEESLGHFDDRMFKA